MTDRRLWTIQEDELIRELVERYGTKKWIQISQQMKLVYPHLARTSKQIRERWHNHLDPSINRSPWTPEEETIVFEAHRVLGSRWKDIANLLVARTDNSVKNHFYSTLRRSLRRMNKFLGFKNSTNQMKALKPTILGTLIEEGDKNQEARLVINGIFQFSRYKPSKSNSKETHDVSLNEKQLYQNAILKIIEFNENYNLRNVKRTRKAKRNEQKQLPFLTFKTKSSEKNAKQTENQILTNKGHESDEVEVKQEEFYDFNEQGQHWEESEGLGFRGLLPQLQVPEADQDFMPCECKIQQFFY